MVYTYIYNHVATYEHIPAFSEGSGKGAGMCSMYAMYGI